MLAGTHGEGRQQIVCTTSLTCSDGDCDDATFSYDDHDESDEHAAGAAENDNEKNDYDEDEEEDDDDEEGEAFVLCGGLQLRAMLVNAAFRSTTLM